VVSTKVAEVAHPSQEGKTLEGHWKVEAPQKEQAQKAQAKGVYWRSQLGGRGVNPTQLSARRGLPTDRPPDKPPPWKGAIVGSLYERTGSPYLSKLASSSYGIRSLSGNATPLQKMQMKVCAPSNYPVSSQAGSSPSQVPEDDECPAGCTRVAAGSWSTGDVCDLRHPSSNLSRNLFLCGGFLSSTESAGSMAQRGNRHLGSLDFPGLEALQAVVP
jgi:hypothetical protein